MKNMTATPLEEFEKALRCLALEIPEEIHADVMEKWEKLRPYILEMPVERPVE